MSLLEIISRLCDVITILADIVEEQQIAIEHSKIEEVVKEEFRQRVKKTDKEMNIIGHQMRKVCNTAEMFGKE